MSFGPSQLLQQTSSVDYSKFGGTVSFPESAPGLIGIGVKQEVCRGDWAKPTQWTVNLGIPMDSRFQPNQWTSTPLGIYQDHGHLFAVVTWGFGGTTFIAEVDWRNGACFGVTGQWVQVMAVLPDDQPVTSGPGGSPLLVSASVVPDAHCIQPAAYRTVFYGDIAAAASQARYVPAFAESFWLRTNGPLALAAFEVEWLEGGIGPVQVAQDNYQASGNRSVVSIESSLPVPFDANWCQLRNTGGALLAGIRAVYKLSLG